MAGSGAEPLRLTVLHIVAPAPFGGLESVLRMLASGQSRRGHRVLVATVLSDGERPHAFVEALRADGIAPLPVHVGARDYRRERRMLRAICREHRPDVVHTHGFRPDVVDGAVARTEGAAVVSTCHGFIETDWRGRLYQWLQRRTLRRFDAVVAVSATIESTLAAAGVPPSRIHLVPNAFDSSRRMESPDEARRALGLTGAPAIGWVGRLSSEKGPDLALDAFARLRHPTAQLVMIGEGRESAALRERAAALQLGDRVRWSGAVRDAGYLFRAFDAYLLSSRTEGTPMSLLEAMAAGVPIVATRVGGVPDVVDDSTARLTDSGDVDGLARALDEVLATPVALDPKVGRARRRLDERFGVEPWLARHESIYRAARAISGATR